MTQQRHVEAARRVMALLFGGPEARSFDIRYWDGSVERARSGAPQFTVVIRTAAALRQMLLPASELAIAETLISGDVEIEGSLEAASRLAEAAGSRVRTARAAARLLPLLLQLPRTRARPGTLRFVGPDGDAGVERRSGAAAIRHHYDVGNAFYALWLDAEMQYTCAYFSSEDDTLEEAQQHKLEHLCRKLRLKPGERLLDIGCGWGGLVRYAAANYGVRAEGITLSAAQADYAQSRITREGLSATCRVDVRDYRDIGAAVRYDKIVAVGVTEHVAADAQPDYFAAAHRVLEPGGLFLNHCEVSIQRARPRTLAQRIGDRLWRRNEFIERYVFPDARLVPAAHVIASAEQVGFELRDVESLREHYAMTLRHWVTRLEANCAEAVRLVGEDTYRVWRLYMSAGADGFASGRINIIQTLLAKPDAAGRSHLPLTRADLYSGERTIRSETLREPGRLPAA
jgi:cyclopropane-fatty-acyl-phospholipid synthase